MILRRQHLTPCEAELTLSGHVKIKSGTSNYWLGHMIQPTNHVFAGGLPQKYPANRVSLQASVHADKIHYLAMCVKRGKKNNTKQMYIFPLVPQRAEPVHNYTGCVEIIEINKARSFYTSDAVAGGNVGRCR